MGKASRASLSRADMILSKSKAVVKGRDSVREEQGEGTDRQERKLQPVDVTHAGMSSWALNLLLLSSQIEPHMCHLSLQINNYKNERKTPLFLSIIVYKILIL